ncbi:hypothetical protein [Inquilinus sp. CA228]|uniref:hypothetical protein n=1 Tax=Inquilinus sp. CA228 TaxID=3455609 RepID=UPI003F8D1F81
MTDAAARDQDRAAAAGEPLPEPDRRLLMSMAAAAERLDMCIKTLKMHVAAGDIPYVLVGRRTKKFESRDLQTFIDRRRRQEAPCPSTSRKASHTTTTTSSSRVYDFTALRERRARQRRGSSKPGSA